MSLVVWNKLIDQRPDQGTLAKIAKNYDTRIDISRHRSVVRFTGNPLTCFHMSKDIEAVLGNVRCIDFDLTPLKPWMTEKRGGHLRPATSTIQWVANTTGTVIDEDAAGEKVSL